MVAARPLLAVENLQVHFPIRKGLLQRRVGQVHAVDGISFQVRPGETLGLVGESGCGKSTTARGLLHLVEPTGGSVRFRDVELSRLSRSAIRRHRRSLQMVFQVGAAIAIGVLIDTFLVRAMVIPSLAKIAGRWNWWPSHLYRRPPAAIQSPKQ